MRILAIDPGLEASTCFYCPGFSFKSGMRWQFFDVPAIGEASNRVPDVRALRDWIMRGTPDYVFTELVNGRPGSGVQQISRFMRSAGMLEATALCCDVTLKRVTPQKWKRFHALPTGATKEDSRQLVLKLHPELQPWLTRKKDHGRAEAALLALFGAHCMQPISPV